MKIALLEGPDEPIYRTLKTAFEESGHSVESVPTKREVPFEIIRGQIERFRPDFCFCVDYYPFDIVNRSGVELESFLQTQSIPVGSLYWDAPWVSGTFSLLSRFVEGPYPTNILFFVIDRAHEMFLRERGMKAVYLASAVDKYFANRKISPELTARFSLDVAHLGTPVKLIPRQLSDEAAVHKAYRELALNELTFWFENYSSVPIGNITELVAAFNYQIEILLGQNPENFASQQNSFFQLTEEKLPPELFKVLHCYKGRLEIIYSWLRLNLFLMDLAEFHPSLFGGEEWTRLIPGYQGSSPRLTDDEMVALFSSAKIIFCLTKYQFKMAVHERPLQVLASGGCPLTDYREGIDEMFRKDEIATYNDVEDAKEQIRYYLKNDSERAEISRRGHRRVLAEHTYHHRVPEIIRQMTETFGLKR